MLSQLAGGSRAYHLPGELELEGEYSVIDFERSIQKAIVRHEVLRTVFREGGGEGCGRWCWRRRAPRCSG